MNNTIKTTILTLLLATTIIALTGIAAAAVDVLLPHLEAKYRVTLSSGGVPIREWVLTETQMQHCILH